MRILYLGMFGPLSTEPLRAIFANKLHQSLTLCGIIVPAENSTTNVPKQLIAPPLPSTDLPILNTYVQETIVHLGWQYQIPVWEVENVTNVATHDLFAELRPDLVCVACFPFIVPQSLLQIAKHGFLNLHPSLLPDYRGPTPLFWIAHQGEERSGVTLHFLDEGIDSGDIVTQVEFDLPLGISEFDLTMLCADYGATLLVEALQDVLVASLPRRPQRNGGRYFLAPSQTDFEIDTTWPAQRAFRFLRGANRWPLTIKTGDTDIIVDTALDYLPEAQLAQPILVTKDECWLQMTPGVLKIRMK